MVGVWDPWNLALLDRMCIAGSYGEVFWLKDAFLGFIAQQAQIWIPFELGMFKIGSYGFSKVILNINIYFYIQDFWRGNQ